MSKVIKVDRISKAFRIGLKYERPDSLMTAITTMLSAPLRNWRELNRLNTFEKHQNAKDLHWALKNVSFDVSDGEVVGIIGRNGAGKSTLLKVLSRITEPTSGEILIKGRVSSLLEVGTGFHPDLSGRENIYLNGTILGMTKREIDKKFDEIVDFSGVDRFLDTPIKRYSSGMKVRLAFAVAAHLEPEILIIDEVLAVGDAEFQKRCIGKMQDVAESGRTVLFVSHSMAAIRALCTKGIVIEGGTIAYDGPVDGAIAKYLEQLDALGTVRTWEETEAPQDEIFRLRSVKAVNAIDESRPFLVDQPIDLVIDYDLLVDHPRVSVIVRVFTRGVCGFSMQSPGADQQAGSYRTVYRIPGGLLNDCNYTVTVILTVNTTDKRIVEREIVAFNVQEEGRPSDYLGNTMGIVRPNLEFMISRLA